MMMSIMLSDELVDEITDELWAIIKEQNTTHPDAKRVVLFNRAALRLAIRTMYDRRPIPTPEEL